MKKLIGVVLYGAGQPREVQLPLVSAPLENSFIVEEGGAYAWPEVTCKDLGRRKDNDYKSTPQQ